MAANGPASDRSPANSRMLEDICNLVQIAQISGSFSGGFCQVSLPLFQGIGEPTFCVSMTISFQMEIQCARLPVVAERP